MTITHFLQKAETFEITTYSPPSEPKQLRETHVAYSGSPHKHPYDDSRIILIADPFSRNTFYYEFGREDVAFAEELPNLVTPDDEAVSMVRIWVKKGSVALRTTPFRVEDTN